jgi:hypothetical protein
MLKSAFNIAQKQYDPAVSRIPELIGTHPGTIAPVLEWQPLALQIVSPVSASRVSGTIEVDVRIRDGNDELLQNLKQVVLTIDGREFAFDKPPYQVTFDTSHARHRLISIKAKAIGKGEESEDDVLAKASTNVIAANGPFDASKPLVLFAGVFEPKIENPRGVWTPEMYQAAFTFSKNIMEHLMHYGYVPDFLLEVDQYTVLVDPDQLDKGLAEYTPRTLVDVLGRNTGPGCEGQTYTDMISTAQWMEPTKTKLGTVLRGYHFPEMGLPNGIPNIFEVFAAHVMSNYWKFAPLGGMRACDQVPALFKDVMADLEDQGLHMPWDMHSLLIGEKPTYLKDMLKKHVRDNGITSIVLYDFLPDVSDFEDTKGIWEDVQTAIDVLEQETGTRLPLCIVNTTGGELQGAHPSFSEAAFQITRNEIETCGIPSDAKVGMILGEHGFPPGNGEDDVIDMNMDRVRSNMRTHYDRHLASVRPGTTEYHLSMNEFNNNPKSWQTSSMECLVDYLHRGFDTIIFQPYYFTYETIDLFEHLRHWAFEIDGIDYEKEFHGGHEIAPNYRSDFNVRGARVIITGSLLGRHEKDGGLPRVKDAYRLFKSGIVETLAHTIRSL